MPKHTPGPWQVSEEAGNGRCDYKGILYVEDNIVSADTIEYHYVPSGTDYRPIHERYARQVRR